MLDLELLLSTQLLLRPFAPRNRTAFPNRPNIFSANSNEFFSSFKSHRKIRKLKFGVKLTVRILSWTRAAISAFNDALPFIILEDISVVKLSVFYWKFSLKYSKRELNDLVLHLTARHPVMKWMAGDMDWNSTIRIHFWYIRLFRELLDNFIVCRWMGTASTFISMSVDKSRQRQCIVHTVVFIKIITIMFPYQLKLCSGVFRFDSHRLFIETN